MITAMGMLVGVRHARRHSHLGWRLRIEHFAEQQHHERAGQGEQRNQPDEVQEIHDTPTI